VADQACCLKALSCATLEAPGELDKYYSEEYAEQPPLPALKHARTDLEDCYTLLPAGETLPVSKLHPRESIAGKTYFSLAE